MRRKNKRELEKIYSYINSKYGLPTTSDYWFFDYDLEIRKLFNKVIKLKRLIRKGNT